MKNNTKIILAFILGAVIFSGITAVAANLTSNKVNYDNTVSGSNKTTVQDAIDDLYDKAKHESTLTLTDTDISNVDMGENHDYRYLDATSVYNKGKADGKIVDGVGGLKTETKTFSATTNPELTWQSYTFSNFTQIVGVYSSRNSSSTGNRTSFREFYIEGNVLKYRMGIGNTAAEPSTYSMTITVVGY